MAINPICASNVREKRINKMTDILNLHPWKVISAEEKDDTYYITAEVEVEPYACPRCGVVHPKTQRFGTRDQEIPDLPIRFKKTVIIARTQRYRCLECRKTFYQALPGIEEVRQATCRLVEHIQAKSLEKPFVDLADDVKLDEKTVRNIFDDYVSFLEETIKFETPVWLGMDELHLRKRTAPYGVLTNIKERTVFDMLKNRSKVTVLKRLSRIKDFKRIELACMDMHDPYKQVIQELLPGIPIVADKFHLVRMASQALERFRISMKEELPAVQRRQLKSDRFAMLRRNENMTEKDKSIQSVWFTAYPDMRIMYDLKERFYEIFEMDKRAEAEKAYEEWEKSIPDRLKTWWKDLLRAIAVGHWRQEIFNYFDFHITNAFTESANAKIRSISQEGRGYGFKAIRAKVLYNIKNLKITEQPAEVELSPDFMLIRSSGPIKTTGVDIGTFQYMIIESMTAPSDHKKGDFQHDIDPTKFFIIHDDQS